MLHEPPQIPNYTIVQPLGSGTSGSVWLAKDQYGERRAIKVAHFDYVGDPDYQRRFRREVMAQQTLFQVSSHVARIFHYDEAHIPPYIIMDYINGVDLNRLIATKQIEQYSLMSRLHWIEALASTLSKAHNIKIRGDDAHGLIHRDIKPQNIRVQGERPYLLDFSISLTSDVEIDNTQDALTIRYSSPEMIGSELSDIFSFGLVAFEILYEIHPITTMSEADAIAIADYQNYIIDKLLNYAWRYPSSIKSPLEQLNTPDVSKKLDRVFHKVFAVEPMSRYQTPKEFADDLMSAVMVTTQPPQPIDISASSTANTDAPHPTVILNESNANSNRNRNRSTMFSGVMIVTLICTLFFASIFLTQMADSAQNTTSTAESIAMNTTVEPTTVLAGAISGTSTPTATRETRVQSSAVTIAPSATRQPTRTTEPTKTHTLTHTAEPTATPTIAPSNTARPTMTSSPEPTATRTHTQTPAPTRTPTFTPTVTATGTSTPTTTATHTPTVTASRTPSRTPVPPTATPLNLELTPDNWELQSRFITLEDNVVTDLRVIYAPPGCIEQENNVSICVEKGFWIDIAPISNATYDFCLRTGDCSRPAFGDLYDPAGALSTQPVVGIRGEVASNYCAWRGGRLPDEAEWRYVTGHLPNIIVMPNEWVMTDNTSETTSGPGLSSPTFMIISSTGERIYTFPDDYLDTDLSFRCVQVDDLS